MGTKMVRIKSNVLKAPWFKKIMRRTGLGWFVTDVNSLHFKFKIKVMRRACSHDSQSKWGLSKVYPALKTLKHGLKTRQQALVTSRDMLIRFTIRIVTLQRPTTSSKANLSKFAIDMPWWFRMNRTIKINLQIFITKLYEVNQVHLSRVYYEPTYFIFFW